MLTISHLSDTGNYAPVHHSTCAILKFQNIFNVSALFTPQKRGRGKLSPPCVAIGRKKQVLLRVSKSFFRVKLKNSMKTDCRCTSLTCWPLYMLSCSFSQLYSSRDFCLHFVTYASWKERNRCQHLPGKPVELVCNNCRLSIALLTGILNLLCLFKGAEKWLVE